jgi:hypothetical protein
MLDVVPVSIDEIRGQNNERGIERGDSTDKL